jgi:hypothetical protein
VQVPFVGSFQEICTMECLKQWRFLGMNYCRFRNTHTYTAFMNNGTIF